MITVDKVQRQIHIEEEYRRRNIQRSQQAIQSALAKGQAATIPVIDRLISAAYSKVLEGITALHTKKSRGIGASYAYNVKQVDPVVLANAALIYVINTVACSDQKSTSIQTICTKLGDIVQTEILIQTLDKIAPRYVDRVQDYLKTSHTKSQNHIKRTYRATAENLHMQYEPWGVTECAQTGALVLKCVLDTGLFVVNQSRKGMKYVEMGPDLRGVIDDVIQNANTLSIIPPMIVPPNKHTTMFDGGYLTDNLHVRPTYVNRNLARKERREVAEAFKNATPLKEALNRLQEVPYRINKFILHTVTQARALGIGVGMPSTKAPPKPEWRLHGVPPSEFTEAEQEEFELWKATAKQWYESEIKRLSQLRGLSSTLLLANEFKDEPTLYFPTYVDWRYRVYFKSSLHPQGSDVQKGLIEFAEGKELGERGLYWLKVHVATCYGVDDVTFDLRVQWTEENIQLIRSAVLNPFDSELFKGADSPYCFLAGAEELVSALDLDNPCTFISHIPVSMDATNSVGQHFSAILRDPIGGELTNLFYTGAEKKADLYRYVLDKVQVKLNNAIKNDPEHATEAMYWKINPVTRAMVKKPTMTFFYSATARSCTEYLLLGAADEGYEGVEGFGLFKLSSYLSGLTRPSIKEALPASAQCMSYMMKIARRTDANTSIKWHTPLGGLVFNHYPQSEKIQVAIRSLGLSKLTFLERHYDKNNSRKAASGIAPNFIHSMDATHLGMVALVADYRIVPVHDSFGTHACDVDRMQRDIREQFHKLHTQYDSIKMLQEAAIAAGAEIDDIPVPQKGSLNLDRVLNSLFFFC